MAAGDNDLGVRLQPQNFLQSREAFLDAVRIGREAEVERDHRRFVQAQRYDRFRTVVRRDHTIAVIGPFQLTLEAFVVLDHEQDGEIGLVVHARFLIGSATDSAAGSKIVKVVPLPGLLSTLSRPPIAAISDRASNAPIPNPPGLLDEKGWNRRLRMKSESIPTPLSAMTMAAELSRCEIRTVTGRVAEQASTAF